MEEKKLTGYPSIDKPWLKYYSEEAKNAKLPECTVYGYMHACNAGHEDDIALNYYARKITYGELFAAIDQTAAAFAALGVKRGDVVTMCSVTTPETVYSFYALNKLGAVLNSVDPRANEGGLLDYINEVGSAVLLVIDMCIPKIQKILAETGVKAVIVVSASDSLAAVKKLAYRLTTARTRMPDDATYIRWPAFIRSAAAQGKPIPATERQKDRPAVIVHTGGTTGIPKGVLLSDDNINALAFQFKLSIMGFERKQRFLDIMPPFIAYGLGNGLHMPLCLGMETILIPKPDPNTLDQLVLQYRPNVSASVPTHWEKLLASKRLAKADLRFFSNPGVGGDGMKVEQEARVNDFLARRRSPSQIAKGYGLTEVCSAASLSMKNCNALGSVGIPFLGNVISIFRPGTQQELGYNEPGEICITGPTVMLGYYENEAETDRILQRHADGQRWVHTGDMGYMTEDGLLYVVDRIKRIIVRTDGFKVYPSMIEGVISRHEAVSACAVIGIQDPGYSQGMVPKAFIVLKADFAGQEMAVREELAALCKKELAEYALPAAYAFRDGLPLTPIGKVDYRALEQEGTA